MTKSPFMNLHEPKSILVPTFSSITLVNPYEIVYVKAMQNYCMLFMENGNQLLSSNSFGYLLDILSQYSIYKCHRSYAIQISKVVRYLNSGVVELEGDVMVPVARRRKVKFLAAINATQSSKLVKQ